MGRSASEGGPVSGIDINAPSAPAGSGFFREAFPTDSDVVGIKSPAYRRGPSSGLWIAQANITPVSAGGTATKIKAPPKTKTLTKSVKKESTKDTDIDIKVKVLADGKSSKLPKKGAHTSFSFKKVKAKFPKINIDRKTKKILVLTTKFEFKGTVTIQTKYGKKAKAKDKSLYGRGTTKADKTAGNISLGFHESCHREDFLDYLKTNPLPSFSIQVGDTIQQYNDATAKFNAAYDKYVKDMDADSKTNTDEVGYKLSKCKADKKCK